MAQPIETNSVEVNGARLHYDAAGSGEALVLLHAGIADRRMWRPQLRGLAEHYRVIAYDMRGFGESALPDAPFTAVDDLEGLRQALGLERMNLAGCSNGGMVALDYALEHPQRVGALVFVCSVPSGYTAESEVIPAQWEAMAAAYKAGDFKRAAALEAEMWVAGPRRTAAQVDARLLARVAEMDEIALASEAARQTQERPTRTPAVERLDKLAARLLVVAGDLDDPDVVKAGVWLAGQVPGTRRVVLQGTAHFPNLEQPEEFNRVVLEFLKDLGSDPKGL